MIPDDVRRASDFAPDSEGPLHFKLAAFDEHTFIAAQGCGNFAPRPLA